MIIMRINKFLNQNIFMTKKIHVMRWFGIWSSHIIQKSHILGSNRFPTGRTSNIWEGFSTIFRFLANILIIRSCKIGICFFSWRFKTWKSNSVRKSMFFIVKNSGLVNFQSKIIALTIKIHTNLRDFPRILPILPKPSISFKIWHAALFLQFWSSCRSDSTNP